MNTPLIPREYKPAPLSRPVRKRMLAVVQAANVCLLFRNKEAVIKAIEALGKLGDAELYHAKQWLAGEEPALAHISLDNIDKLTQLIESIERVRPQMQMDEAAEKAVKAMKELAEDLANKQAETHAIKGMTAHTMMADEVLSYFDEEGNNITKEVVDSVQLPPDAITVDDSKLIKYDPIFEELDDLMIDDSKAIKLAKRKAQEEN